MSDSYKWRVQSYDVFVVNLQRRPFPLPLSEFLEPTAESLSGYAWRIYKTRVPNGCYVYALFDVAGRCLYVGQTRNTVSLRLADHRAKAWGCQISRIEYLRCRDRSELDALEESAAERLRPLHGKEWGSTRGRRRSRLEMEPLDA